MSFAEIWKKIQELKNVNIEILFDMKAWSN